MSGQTPVVAVSSTQVVRLEDLSPLLLPINEDQSQLHYYTKITSKESSCLEESQVPGARSLWAIRGSTTLSSMLGIGHNFIPTHMREKDTR